MAPTKFTPRRQEKYLDLLRKGTTKIKAARAVGVAPGTVRRLRQADADFAQLELLARAEATEVVEGVLYEAATQDREPWAVKMWLAANDRETYGQQAKEVHVKGEVQHVHVTLTEIERLQQQLSGRAAERAELTVLTGEDADDS